MQRVFIGWFSGHRPCKCSPFIRSPLSLNDTTVDARFLERLLGKVVHIYIYMYVYIYTHSICPSFEYFIVYAFPFLFFFFWGGGGQGGLKNHATFIMCCCNLGSHMTFLALANGVHDQRTLRLDQEHVHVSCDC